MSRISSTTDFVVTVDGIGTFTFAKRSMRSEISIGCEYSRLTEGIEKPSVWLDCIATWISDLKILTVSHPDGWNIDEMDPGDNETYRQMGAVHRALREKEDSFRQNKNKAVQAAGAGSGEGDGILVPSPVQPGAD